jgi:hypothetical protein
LPFSAWRASPEAGDIVAVFDTVGGGSWRTAVADSVSVRADGAGCTPSSGFLSVADSAARRPVTRLAINGPLAAGAAVGTPVRILRRARWVLTFGSDRAWSLSYRRCTASGSCGASQPAAGPLASAADSGLLLAIVADGSRLEATVSTPARTPGAARESRHFVIALRNHAPGAP